MISSPFSHGLGLARLWIPIQEAYDSHLCPDITQVYLGGKRERPQGARYKTFMQIYMNLGFTDDTPFVATFLCMSLVYV